MHVRISEAVSSYKLNWFVCTWFRDDQQQQLILIDVLPVGPWSWVGKSGITESSTDRPTHRPYHRPTWSVMRSVSDGRWVDVVEGALLQGRLAAGG